MDLSLALVEEDLGSKVALAVARDLVLFLRRPGGQSQFSRSLAAQASARKPLSELLVWAVENLDKDLSVENLASRAAMSRRNFTRVFTAELSTSPAHYIEQLRVEAGRRLLEESRRSVEEIAFACGFSSAELMRRAFLRSIRTTPSQYREVFDRLGILRSARRFSSTYPALKFGARRNFDTAFRSIQKAYRAGPNRLLWNRFKLGVVFFSQSVAQVTKSSLPHHSQYRLIGPNII